MIRPRRHLGERVGNKTRCPQCGQIAYTLKTDQMTPAVREVTYLCGNAECLCRFVAQISLVRIINPSRCIADDQPTQVR